MSGGCGNVVNPLGFSIISMAGTRGKRGGDFLFKADQREAALWLPLFPLPAAAIFLFASFSFGGGFT